jgi:membrane-bound metal-dependent hydrolase YbcI (DUF457 family)
LPTWLPVEDEQLVNIYGHHEKLGDHELSTYRPNNVGRPQASYQGKLRLTYALLLAVHDGLDLQVVWQGLADRSAQGLSADHRLRELDPTISEQDEKRCQKIEHLVLEDERWQYSGGVAASRPSPNAGGESVNALEHMLIGAGAGAAVAHLSGGNVGLMMLAGAVAGPLPDIDTRWSPRWRYPRNGAACGLLEHRGPTHSLLAAVVVLVVATAVFPVRWPQQYLLAEAFAAGYASHLVADALSPMGQPLLWPVVWTRLRLVPKSWRVRSGSRLIELPVALVLLFVGLTIRP